MGHYFSEAGYQAFQCGRTHHFPDTEEVRKPDPVKGALKITPLPGLQEWLIHEASSDRAHRAHLEARGYPEEVCRTPAVPHRAFEEDAEKDPSAYPVDVREEDTDTAFVTDGAVRFLNQPAKDPWFLFLSYWKPHPPFYAPAPYHELYDPSEVPAPNRIEAELENPHPLVTEYRKEFNGKHFDEEKSWRQLRATYYGLISQIDYNLGRVMEALKASGQDKNTIIFFSSDHGEYMGDHWLQNKEMFYDEAQRVPWLMYDPRPQADSTRGTVCDAFVECIDALPTLLQSAGVGLSPAIQGRSLLPWIQGESPDRWRTAVFADWDFRCYKMSTNLGLEPHKCRGWMIRDRQIKYWHFNGLPDVLFDLEKDPGELRNRADDPAYRDVVQEYLEKLIDWRMSTEDPSRISWTYRITEDRRRSEKSFWHR
jgi:arylsulfatase A-like enzyme